MPAVWVSSSDSPVPEALPDAEPEPEPAPEPDPEAEPSVPTWRTSDPSSEPHAAAANASGIAHRSRRVVSRRAMERASADGLA